MPKTMSLRFSSKRRGTIIDFIIEVTHLVAKLIFTKGLHCFLLVVKLFSQLAAVGCRHIFMLSL